MSEEKRVEWTDDRIKEFTELRDLLITVRSLNNGSNFLSKVEDSIKSADKLYDHDYDTTRPSFIEYLWNDIVAARTVGQQKENK